MAAAGYPAAIGVGISREVTSHNPVTLIGGMVRRGAGGEELRAGEELSRAHRGGPPHLRPSPALGRRQRFLALALKG